MEKKLIWIFGKRLMYENLEKKKSFHNKHIYVKTYLYNIGTTDILKFYENLFKTLPTKGNEKRKSKVTPLFSGKIELINIFQNLQENVCLFKLNRTITDTISWNNLLTY